MGQLTNDSLIYFFKYYMLTVMSVIVLGVGNITSSKTVPSAIKGTRVAHSRTSNLDSRVSENSLEDGC